MHKEATGTEILMLGEILERIGMEETLRAVQFAAEWNAEIAAEIADTNSGNPSLPAQTTFIDAHGGTETHLTAVRTVSKGAGGYGVTNYDC
jgi:hypothetical protein